MLMLAMSRVTFWLLGMVRHVSEILEYQACPEVPWTMAINQKLSDIWPRNTCGESGGLRHPMAPQKRVMFTPSQ